MNFISKLRFLDLVTCILLGFYLLAISQSGPKWEVSPNTLARMSIIRMIIWVLVFLEVVFAFLDRRVFFLYPSWVKALYIFAIGISILFALVGGTEMLVQFRVKHPILSTILSYATYYGIAISVVLGIILTQIRSKAML